MGPQGIFLLDHVRTAADRISRREDDEAVDREWPSREAAAERQVIGDVARADTAEPRQGETRIAVARIVGVRDGLPVTVDGEVLKPQTVVWCTGFRPDYSWLGLPVLDDKGHLRHDGGVVDAPGLYALGLPFLRRRKSTFISGAEGDARELVEHLAGYLAMPASRS